jgi:hypothetical protein
MHAQLKEYLVILNFRSLARQERKFATPEVDLVKACNFTSNPYTNTSLR